MSERTREHLVNALTVWVVISAFIVLLGAWNNVTRERCYAAESAAQTQAIAQANARTAGPADLGTKCVR
jgi:uncharacterized BrkB/YihY/UPF0761 family membrane protein